MKKITFEIEHAVGDTYMAFELTIDDNGEASITKCQNCSLADIDGDYIFNTDNDNYRVQADELIPVGYCRDMVERYKKLTN